MPLVRELVALHLADTPVDADGYEPEHLFPAEHLTRDAAVGFVSQQFTDMGYQPDTVLCGNGPQVAYNLVAEWPGTSEADEVVLVGAHLDAFYGGADDNGTAVAALLETARAVRHHQFAKTIRFVAFDLEEFGCVGSTRYVRAGHADDVVAAIVMDMIGYADSSPNSQDDIMGVRLPDPGDYLMVVGNQTSADMTRDFVALGNNNKLAKLHGLVAAGDGSYFLASAFMRSDHGLLWYKDIPAVLLTDTANFRNPHYHQPTDLLETLDESFFADNTRALAAAVAHFAEVQ